MMIRGGGSEETKPWSAHDWGLLADDLFRQGRYLEAVMMYQKALEIDSQDKELWNSMGLALCRLNRIQEAALSFEKAMAIDDGYLDARTTKGWFFTG